MSSRAIATRYARALFDVTLKESGDPVRVGDQLQAFTALVGGHAELSRVLANPAVPTRIKHGIVAGLAGQVTLDGPLKKLLLLLADRDRTSLLPQVTQAYHARLLQHQQVVEAQVTTAAPIDEDRAEAIAQGLAQKTGLRVRVTRRVDPALIGGVVARIGSTVYDGSVARQLERLHARLAQDA